MQALKGQSGKGSSLLAVRELKGPVDAATVPNHGQAIEVISGVEQWLPVTVKLPHALLQASVGIATGNASPAGTLVCY